MYLGMTAPVGDPSTAPEYNDWNYWRPSLPNITFELETLPTPTPVTAKDRRRLDREEQEILAGSESDEYEDEDEDAVGSRDGDGYQEAEDEDPAESIGPSAATGSSIAL